LPERVPGISLYHIPTVVHWYPGKLQAHEKFTQGLGLGTLVTVLCVHAKPLKLILMLNCIVTYIFHIVQALLSQKELLKLIFTTV
jgi:hypothetical protein